MSPSADDCARALIEVVPEVMQRIRSEIRSQRGPELSVLQLRVLAFLNNRPGVPLSAVAEHVGLTLPSMSSQVTGLVERGLVDRAVAETDRRYVTLKLTAEGQSVMHTALQGARINLTAMLTSLSEAERNTVTQALEILRSTFSSSLVRPV